MWQSQLRAAISRSQAVHSQAFSYNNKCIINYALVLHHFHEIGDEYPVPVNI